MKKYLCGVTFQHELGYADDISFFNSLEEAKEKLKCWKECGIVELDLDDEDDPEFYSGFDWVEEQNFNWSKK